MTEETIFTEAMEIADPEARAAFLDRACSGNPDVRVRVDKLLAEHAEAGSFLGSPAPLLPATDIQNYLAEGGTHDIPAARREGTAIGPYKLVEVIGEGGMGTVWLAQQQEPVKRLVALKVIKAGMDSKSVLARFEAERQALALMDHPNIAKVLDAGASPDGRPYFVMELVKGVPITKFCDERRLTPRQRLELFVPVCQAVQHAHQKGVIHRDLKPSNVLVALYDGRPVPKVIDFGIAKAAGQPLTEKTLVTGLGTVVGTPEYMSPEQAELNQLDIDTRSDIYSLGILLYELLTGTTPLQHKRVKEAALLEVLRLVREEEPPRPSTRLSTTDELPSIAARRGTEPGKLSGLVRGELDWIVMKALEKDRNRRYETANGFGMDVQRYLADEAVQACPPSVGYRLRKFVRRNKGGLAAAALVLFCVVLLGSGAGWMLRDRAARHAKVAGQVEMILTEVDRLEAEQKWPEALASARRAEAVVAGEADAATEQRVHAMLKGLKFIDLLERVRMQRAVVVEGKFDHAGADHEYSRSFRDYGVDIDELPVEASIDRLKAHPALAVPLAAALDDWVDARRLAEQDAAGWMRVVAVARGLDPEPLRDRLRAICGRPVSEVQHELRRLADSINMQGQRPATIVSLARTLRQIGHTDSALGILRDARAVYPADFWINLELGTSAHEHKDREEAVRFYTAAVSIRPNSAAAHNNLGVSLTEHGKLDEAVAACRKAIELAPKYAYAHVNLGMALGRQGKPDEAVAALRTAIELDPKYANAHSNLGTALMAQGKPEEAVAAYRRAIELDPKYALAHYNLGYVLSTQGKLDESVAAYRKAIELDPKYALAHTGLGSALRDQKKPDEAIAAYHRAIELDPKNAAAHANLGFVLNVQGKLDESVAAYRTAIELDPKNAAAHYNLGLGLKEQGKLAQAIVALERVIELEPEHAQRHNELAWWLATEPGATHRDPKRAVELAERAVKLEPEEWAYWHTLGVAYYRASKWEESLAALEKSCRLEKSTNGQGNAWQWLSLSMVHWRMGSKEEARSWYDKAIELERVWPEELVRFEAEAGELLGVPPAQRPESGLLESVRQMVKAEQWDQAAVLLSARLDGLPLETGAGWDAPRRRLCRTLAQWDEVFRRVVELRPQDADLWIGRGRHFALRSDWNEAAAAYERAVPSQPLTDEGFEYACLLLLQEDRAGYQQWAQRVAELAAASQDSFELYVAVRTCAMTLEPVVPAPRLVEWAEQMAGKDPNAWHLHALGAAYYRAGDFEKALETLRGSNASGWGEVGNAQNWLVLAMGQHRLGRADEARQSWDEARRRIADATPTDPGAPAEGAVPDWLGVQVLRMEAEALLAEGPQGSSPRPKDPAAAASPQR